MTMDPQNTAGNCGATVAGSLPRRPWVVTAAGIVAIVAGALPAIEVIAMLVSRHFRERFLGLVQTIVPASREVILFLLPVIAAADIILGVGVLTRRRWATPGMILRSVLGVWLDYINFRTGNHVGAVFGLAINIFVVWALLRSPSRAWFRARHLGQSGTG
jgi:hypothetical protein